MRFKLTGEKQKALQKVEKNSKSVNKNESKKDKDYILKEAEMLINSYISKIENKEKKDFNNKSLKEKYKKLKNYAIASTVVCILQTLILFAK